MGEAVDGVPVGLGQRCLQFPGEVLLGLGEHEQVLLQPVRTILHPFEGLADIDAGQFGQGDPIGLDAVAGCGQRFGVFRLQPACQGGDQLIGIDGFGEVGIHACAQGPLPIAGHGIGGHGDDGQLDEAFLGTNLAGRFITVHHRHLAVHQHAVEMLLLQPCQSLLALVGDGDPNAVVGEHVDRQFLVDGVVLHQQDFHSQQLTADAAGNLLAVVLLDQPG